MRSLFYQNLERYQIYYDKMLQNIQNRKKSFSPEIDVDYSELFSHVMDDYPELFYVKQEIKKVYSLFGKEIFLQYIYSPLEEKDIYIKLDNIAKDLMSNLINEHQSEYDRVRILHDYLKANVKYDMEAANSNHLSDRAISESHTIVGALINHKCVCEGFAKAMKFLCDKIGIVCWVISGKGNNSLESGPHSWNIVKINGYYHHVDVTWDNQYAENSKTPNYGYLNLSDEEISKDHTWNRKNYPSCPVSPYNYFRVNSALIDSKKQLENFLYNNFLMEEESIMFRVVRGSYLEMEIHGCLQDVIQCASARCKHITLSQCRYTQIPEQLTFCIQPLYSYK